MKRNHDGLLESVSGAVSDGDAVDWQAREREASSEREKRCLHNLRLVSEVSRLARTLALPSGASPASLTGAERAVSRVRVRSMAEEETIVSETGPRGALDAADETLPFEIWGSLKLLEHIGSGGSAAVYRAWDQRLHRQVALKLLRPDLSLDPDWESRFLAEGRLLARVEHPHVVRIYGLETHAGRIGIWMELVHGTSLADVLSERGALGAAEVVRLGIDLCGALGAIHAAKVIHQDIKPHNVLLDTNGRAVLMDFGAGRLRSATGDPSLMVGTPRYMAPELFTGVPPSPQSDLYSLGLLLATLVLGRHPAARAGRVRRRQREPIRLAALRLDLPQSFTSCVDRALAEDKLQRFPSAEAMREALEKVESSWAGATSRIGESGIPGSMTHTGRPRRRRQAPLLAFATLLLIAGAYAVAQRLATPEPLSVRADLAATSAGTSRTLEADAVISTLDRLELHLDLSRTAHVYVLNVDASGQAVLLFPMAGGGPQNPLPAHQALVLPGELSGKRLGWSLSDDLGVEKFLIVASIERLDAFEAAAAKVPAVALGGGLTATPIADDAITALVRGVTGVAKIADSSASEAHPDLFALARRLAADKRATGSIWLHELRVEKRGS